MLWARYGRVSTDEQEDALTRQLFELEQSFIENNWQLNDDLLFVDVQSGWDDNEESREAFSRLMTLVRTGGIYGIVAARIDRLARETEILSRLWKILERSRVKLYIVEKGRTYDTSHADWKDFINDAISAEEESRKISSRVDRAHKYNRHMKRANTRCPFGYRRSKDKTYEPDLSQWNESMTVWAAARRMVEIFFETEMNQRQSIRRIGEELNKHWSPQGLRVWLSNEVLRGDIPYIRYYGESEKNRKKRSRHASKIQGYGKPKEIVYDQHTPLITRAEAAEIQSGFEIKKARGKNSESSRVYPLSGLIRCAICGSTCRASIAHNKYIYAYCRARRNGKSKVSTYGGKIKEVVCGDDPILDMDPKSKRGKAGISHNKIEKAIIKKLCEAAEMIADELVHGIQNNLPSPEQLKLEEQIDQLQRFIDEQGDTHGLLRQQISILQSQIPQIKNDDIDESLRQKLCQTFGLPEAELVDAFLKEPEKVRQKIYRRFVKQVLVRHSEIVAIELKPSIGFSVMRQ